MFFKNLQRLLSMFLLLAILCGASVGGTTESKPAGARAAVAPASQAPQEPAGEFTGRYWTGAQVMQAL